MDKNQFKQQAKKYFNNQLSEEELKEFLGQLEEREEEFYEAVDDEITLHPGQDFDKEAAFEALSRDERFSKTKVRWLAPFAWTAVACSVLLVLAFVFYFNQQDHKDHRQAKTVISQKNQGPEKEDEHAAIRLADGTQLALADIGEEELNYDGVKLSRISASLYKISIDSQSHASRRPYHEFTTGKGTSYGLLLPDGSKVDMNSGTRLRLDPRFNVANRDCELSGEAYFDVKRNERIAFRVKTRDYDVKVLGTQFNIKSYPKSSYSQTALVEGSVHVTKDNKEVNLLPGDQVSAEAGVLQNKSKANLRDVLAWKEGYFRFTDAGIEEIMENIAAWYDIDEVQYHSVSNDSFTGSIMRTRNLNDVLKSIEKISNLRFEIKERRVIVGK